MTDAEADFWAAFVYDNATETWLLAPGLSPLDIIPIIHAKTVADFDAIEEATGRPEIWVSRADLVAAIYNLPKRYDTPAKETEWRSDPGDASTTAGPEPDGA